MSLIGDIFAGVRRIMLLEDRVDRLTDDLAKLNTAHAETRERLIRVEVIIDEARRAEARYRPGS